MPDPVSAPPRPRRLPIWKKALFSAVTVFLFFGLLEGVLFLLGVQPLLYRDDPFMGFSGSTPLFVASEDGGAMVTAPNKLRWFNAQRFAARKAPNTLRVFCVGGSTTYGRPYDDPLSFCGILRALLAVADPNRRYEVINAGGISYASYRVSHLMEELDGYEPDLFVVYSGHNEFLEQRTYAGRIDASPAAHEALLARSRLFALMRSAFGRDGMSSSQKVLMDDEVKTILDASVGPKDYVRDDAWRDGVLAHYRFNLDRMVRVARGAAAEVILVVPAANLKDCSPFKSERSADLSAEEARQNQANLERAGTLLADGKPKEALRASEFILQLDARDAEAHFRRGRALYALAQYEEARAAFQRAIDEDVCPLRAMACMQQTVRDVAKERDVALYDFAAAIERRSPHGIPDATFFLDHVHCNLEGYWTLALGVLDTLAERGLVELSAGWNAEKSDAVRKQITAHLDKEATGISLRNLAKVMSWAGKVEEAGRLARRAGALLGEDPEAAAVDAAGAAAGGDLKTAITQFEKAISLDPGDAKNHFNLGVALQKAGEVERAADQYAEALRLRPAFADAALNLAVIRHRQRKLVEAIGHYQTAIRHKPDFAPPHANLGRALLERGDPKKASASFREALRIDPDYLPARLGIADCLAAEGRFSKALPHYRKAADASPADENAQCGLAAALAETGKLEEGIDRLHAFLKKQPDAAQAKALLIALREAREETK